MSEKDVEDRSCNTCLCRGTCGVRETFDAVLSDQRPRFAVVEFIIIQGELHDWLGQRCREYKAVS